MTSIKYLLALIAALTAFAAFSPTADAQKPGKDYFEFVEYGFKYKPLRDFDRVPAKSEQKAAGLLGKLMGPELGIPIKGQGIYNFQVDQLVLRFVDRKIILTGDGAKAEITEEKEDLADYVDDHYLGVDKKKVLVDKVVKLSKHLSARHRQWGGKVGGGGPFLVDTWTFEVRDEEVHLLFTVPTKHERKWLKAFAKCAKTFKIIEIAEKAKLHAGMTYKEQLEFHDMDQRDEGGWRAYASPSKRYIIKSDSADEDFIDKVIERLEVSRNLFEKDFPPLTPIKHVSIVRVCSTEEIFHTYGDTPPGVAGWFSPSSTELVLYDSKNTDRNSTYSVMTHEGFHQYCHFLFNESAAHRWFDEGHGDYYGAAKMGRSAKAPMKITKQMPAGLDRLSVIKDMVQRGDYVPLKSISTTAIESGKAMVSQATPSPGQSSICSARGR